MIKLLSIFILFICASAQEDTVTVHHDGQHCKCDYLDRAWHDDEEPYDTIWIETPFLKGILNGTQKQYFKSGQVEGETVYINGWAEGLSYSYDTLGNLTLRSTWKHGKHHGEMYFYENGIPTWVEIYRNDTLISKRKCKVSKDLMNDSYCP